MRLKNRTIKLLRSLAVMLGAENEAQAIAVSLELTQMFIKSIAEGSKIYIVDELGNKKILKFKKQDEDTNDR